MTLPRRLEPSTLEKLAINTTRMTPGAGGGLSRHVRQQQATTSGPGGRGGNVVFIYHGDDSTVARDADDSDWVVWVGAASPTNGFATDGWYTADVTI